MAGKGSFTVDSSKYGNSSSMMEEVSHQDYNQQINKESLSFLPPLPRLHSSLPSPVSPPSDQAYLQASTIFQQLREEKPVTLLHYAKKVNTPLPESGDKATQRQAYQLAFNTLKYQDLLEDIIADSCFHTSQHISADSLPMAMVMLFDFQDRRFLLRERSTKEGGERLQEVRDMESCLHRCKTKLAASLARCRVKQNLQSVSCFLSDHVRTKQRQAKRLPIYAWVNMLKASVEEVCEVLQNAGLCEVKSTADLKDSTFCWDSLCPDTLVFSQQLDALLQRSSLSATHVLNIQDRSVCVVASALRPLLFENVDVLVVGSFSALTVAHVAVVATACSGRVLVCGGDHTSVQLEEIQGLLREMDIKNVQVLSEAFHGLKEWDATVQRLRVIVVLPQCSSSGLNDPVPTMHSEHGDWDLLPDLSHGSVSRRKLHTIAAQQARLLSHSLTFSKVQTVVYCTRSVYPEENEQLVKRVLEKAHTHPKLLPFRVNGPIFPVDSQSGNAADTKFFRLQPSPFTNGCFVARLVREGKTDPTKVETVQDVLARAAAKGLLGGVTPEKLKTSKKGKSRKNRVASATGESSLPSSQESGAGLVNGLDPVAPSEHEEQKGKGDLTSNEGEEGHKRVGEVGGEEEEKNGRLVKGRKRKLRRRPKQTKRAPEISKHQPKSHKKKSTKRKVNQPHHKRRVTRSKQRRIPRLTLTLMSSAKPPDHLSPIRALVHKLSDNPVIKLQQTVCSAPSPTGKHPSPACVAPPTPPAASKRLQRQTTRPEGAEKTLRDAAKPASRFKARGQAVRPEEVSMAADCVLPPISSPSSSSVRSRNGSSLFQSLSRASPSHRTNMSASSSSVSLPGL